MRLSGIGLGKLAQCADLVVVFDDKQEKRHEALLQAIKNAGLMVEVASVGKSKGVAADEEHENVVVTPEEESQTTLF